MAGNRNSSQHEIYNDYAINNLEPLNFYLRHVSSTADTFERLRHDIPKLLQENRELVLGEDVCVHIKEVNNPSETNLDFDPNKFSFKQSVTQLREEGVQVLGMGNEFLFSLQNINDNRRVRNVKWNKPFNFNVPYIKLEVFRRTDSSLICHHRK